MPDRQNRCCQQERASSPPLPAPKKLERPLAAPEQEALLDQDIKEELKEGRIKKIWKDPVFSETENENRNPLEAIREIMEKAGDTVGTACEEARKKASGWLDFKTGWEGWDSAKRAMEKKLAEFNDYAAPICRETESTVKDAWNRLQDKLDSDAVAKQVREVKNAWGRLQDKLAQWK